MNSLYENMPNNKGLYCTYINVSFQFEGFHKWVDAPKEVGFLKDLHRHIFHVKATIQVSHEDRDLEFILVKRWLESEVPNMKNVVGEGASCETMCRYFIDIITDKHPDVPYVMLEVSEDGENGGIVEYRSSERPEFSEESKRRWNRTVGGQILLDEASN